MASDFPESLAKALPDGKKYHCNLMYNYASRINLVTADTKLSLKFVEFLVEKLKSWGYTKCYYYDENAKAGEDVFDQNFDPASSSMSTLVIITEEFIKNHWIRYVEKTVLKTKIDEKEDNRSDLIPIVIGKASVPQELAATGELSFDVDENTWHGQEQGLKKLKRTLDGKVPVTRTPSQDPGDGILRSDVGHMIVNPVPSLQGDSSITLNRNESQMESLSSSVAAMHVLSTLPLQPESLATSSQASQDHETSSSSSRTDTGRGHVMISYSWTQKKKVSWIKEQLVNHGFPIWIDDENMGPNMHSSMFQAVEGALVVLLCMSQKYMESKDCKSEALLARKLNKIIIPLKMEDFIPVDWLAFVTVDYLYYNFSGNKCEEEMKNLLKVLATHYKKEFKQLQITPFASFFMPQEKTESAQNPGAN